MKAKSSAHYQREFRRRMREQGLVKKEVWIRPEHAKRLSAYEKQLRQPGESAALEQEVQPLVGGSFMSEAVTIWTTEALHEALLECELVTSGQASVELVEGIDPSLQVIMHEYGDLPVFVNVAGEQMLVEAVLWPASDVRDLAEFNDAVLRSHKYFPLSTISLESAVEEDYYMMFGALSSASILPNVLLEIEVLAGNVIQATEAYAQFLTVALEA